MNSVEETVTNQLVVFVLGTEQYALPIQNVQEVIRYQRPRSVASTDSTLLGVINLRGRIVPVHDLRGELGLEAAPLPAGEDAEGEVRHKIVLVGTEQDVVGIVVDDVLEVLSIESGEFEDLPAAGNPLVAGVVKAEDRLIVLFDPSAVMNLASGEGA